MVFLLVPIGFPMVSCKSRFSHESHVNREYVCLSVCVKRACLSVLGRPWSIFRRPRGSREITRPTVGGRGVGPLAVLTEGYTERNRFIDGFFRIRPTTVSHGPSPRGEAAGLRTPAASHRPLPYFGYVRWVKFKLFVHYSFIIRSLLVLIRA